MMAAASFSPDFASPSEWAAMYRAHGLQVVPARYPMRDRTDKRPVLSTWRQFQSELVADGVFASFFPPDAKPNMGLITGKASGNVVVIDIDEHTNSEAALWWQGVLALNNYGREPETWRQQTGGGGKQVFFRAPPEWHAPTNRTPIGVDIRGQGGFAMLPPSIHLSREEYRWLDGCAPWGCDLADAPQWLLDAIDDLVEQYGGDTQAASGGERTPSPATDFDAFGARVDGRESALSKWVWGALVDMHRDLHGVLPPDGGAARMEDSLAGWLRHTKTRLRGVPNDLGLERECRGATAFRAKWQRALAKWNVEIAAHAAQPRPGASQSAAGTQEAPAGASPPPHAIAIVPAFPIDEEAIPVRDWIVPGLLLKRHLSVLVAPPGSGKSLLTLQIGISIAAQLAWAGWVVRQPGNVLIVNAEDDTDEMRRRLAAAARAMGVNGYDLRDRLFLASNPENIVIARTDARTKTVVRTPLLDELVAVMKANNIRVLIVDPFAETFEGDENSNSEVKWAGILWREVARRADAAVLLVHHTRKYAGAMAGDADASRGGGALIGTARIVATLFGMTEDEASVMDVQPEDRTRYVRFDDAKANLSLVTGHAKWFEKQTMTLGNGTALVSGDEVGVLMPWKPPGMLDDVSKPTIGQALDAIDRGLVDQDGAPTGSFYTLSATAANKDRWAGAVLMRHFGCDETRAKRILREWESKGVFEAFEYQDPKQRKPRQGTRTVLANRPDKG